MNFKYMSYFNFSAMVSPIISILANDKLTGENYVKWKSNMNAILVCVTLYAHAVCAVIVSIITSKAFVNIE